MTTIKGSLARSDAAAYSSIPHSKMDLWSKLLPLVKKNKKYRHFGFSPTGYFNCCESEPSVSFIVQDNINSQPRPIRKGMFSPMPLV